MSVNEKMTAIANAIRDKTGGTEALTLDDMASGVNDVYEAGVSVARKKPYFDTRVLTSMRCFFANAAYNGFGTFNSVLSLFSLFDTSNVSDFYGFCRDNRDIVAVPFFDMSSAIDCNRMFVGCEKIKTIELLNFSKANDVTYAFYNCFDLEEVRFEGVIPLAVSFSSSANLSQASINNIIEHLADLTGQTAEKLTLHSTTVTNLTEEQFNKIINKNWTIS